MLINLLIIVAIISGIYAFYQQIVKDFGNKANLEHQLEDTYSAIQILQIYQYQQERNATDTTVTTSDIIWAKSVLNSVGSQFGHNNVGTNLQPCY